jgi:hypothetical protein
MIVKNSKNTYDKIHFYESKANVNIDHLLYDQ